MCLQLKARGDGNAFDHPGKAGGREWRAAFADENEGRPRALALEPSQRPKPRSSRCSSIAIRHCLASSARPSVDHEHRSLYGFGAEPVQGFVAGLTYPDAQTTHQNAAVVEPFARLSNH